MEGTCGEGGGHSGVLLGSSTDHQPDSWVVGLLEATVAFPSRNDIGSCNITLSTTRHFLAVAFHNEAQPQSTQHPRAASSGSRPVKRPCIRRPRARFVALNQQASACSIGALQWSLLRQHLWRTGELGHAWQSLIVSCIEWDRVEAAGLVTATRPPQPSQRLPPALHPQPFGGNIRGMGVYGIDCGGRRFEAMWACRSSLHTECYPGEEALPRALGGG
jgi:hypothetical protein